MTPFEQQLFKGMQSKCIRLELEIIRLHSALDSIARLVNLGKIKPSTSYEHPKSFKRHSTFSHHFSPRCANPPFLGCELPNRASAEVLHKSNGWGKLECCE